MKISQITPGPYRFTTVDYPSRHPCGAHLGLRPMRSPQTGRYDPLSPARDFGAPGYVDRGMRGHFGALWSDDTNAPVFVATSHSSNNATALEFTNPEDKKLIEALPDLLESVQLCYAFLLALDDAFIDNLYIPQLLFDTCREVLEKVGLLEASDE